jgi:hypothetical protein
LWILHDGPPCSFFSRYHALFRQPLPRSVDRKLPARSTDLTPADCRINWRASFTPNEVTCGSNCGVQMKQPGQKFTTYQTSFSWPGVLGEIDLSYALIVMANRFNTFVNRCNWQDAVLTTANKLFVCFCFLVLLDVVCQ